MQEFISLNSPPVCMLENFQSKKLTENTAEQRDLRKGIQGDEPALSSGPTQRSSASFNVWPHAALGIC